MLNYPRRDAATIAIEEVKRFLESMDESNPIEKIVLVVSHGGLLAQLFAALYQDQCTERIGNLSLTILEKNETSWDLRLYNCLRHLEEIIEEMK